MLVDSHCHLDQLDLNLFDNSMDNVLSQAAANKVEYFLCVCIDMDNYPAVLDCAKHHIQVSASVGVHPNVTGGADPSVEELVAMAKAPEIVAIGETGLDYYRSEGNLDWQRARFRRHIQAARQINKPLIVHSRDAEFDTINTLELESANEVGGVLHCFTGSQTMAEACLDLNFYISFSGILTFNSAKELQAIAKTVPLDRILIETDCPYLAPVPFRGKPNQPAYVLHVAEFLAELRGISFAEVAKATSDNFYKLFNIDRRNI